MSRNAFYYNQLFSQEIFENFGTTHLETTFEFMSKFQHYTNIEYMKKLLKNYASQDYNPLLLHRLLKYSYDHYFTINKEISSLLQNNNKIWDILYKSPNYKGNF